MRIAHVTPVFGGPGGIEQYVAGLVGGLASQGDEVRVLASGRPRAGFTAPPGVEVEWFERRRIARYELPRGLAGAIREAGRWADVVHSHQHFASGTILSLALAPRVAISCYLHDEPARGLRGQRRRLQLRSVIGRADLVVAISQAELALIEQVRSPTQSVVIWPGIERRPVPAQVGVDDRRVRVLCVGRLVPHKQLDRAVEAAGLDPAIELRIVGDGPQRPALQAKCTSVGLEPEVVLRGLLDDDALAEQLGWASVVLSLSSEESFGLTLQEAVAAGSHLVVSDIPSHQEIVANLAPMATVLSVDAAAQEIAAALLRYVGTPSPEPQDLPSWDERGGVLHDAYKALLG